MAGGGGYSTSEQQLLSMVVTLTLPPIGCDARTQYFNPERRLHQVDGVEEITTADGRLVYDCTWKDHLRHGKAAFYHEGRKVHEVQFFKGWRSGVERVFNIMGNRIYEAEWTQDTLHGPVIWYDDDGLRLLCELSYNRGKLLFNVFKNHGSERRTAMNIELNIPHNHSMVSRLILDVITENKQITDELRSRSASISNSGEIGSTLRRRAASITAAALAARDSLSYSNSRTDNSVFDGSATPPSASTSTTSLASDSRCGTPQRYRTKESSSASNLSSVFTRPASVASSSTPPTVGGSRLAGHNVTPPLNLARISGDDGGAGATAANNGSNPGSRIGSRIAAQSAPPTRSMLSALSREQQNTPTREREEAQRREQFKDASLADYYTVVSEASRRNVEREQSFRSRNPAAVAAASGASTPTSVRSLSPPASARFAGMMQLIIANPDDSLVVRIAQNDDDLDDDRFRSSGAASDATLHKTSKSKRNGDDSSDSEEVDPIFEAIRRANKEQRAPTTRIKHLLHRKAHANGIAASGTLPPPSLTTSGTLRAAASALESPSRSRSSNGGSAQQITKKDKHKQKKEKKGKS